MFLSSRSVILHSLLLGTATVVGIVIYHPVAIAAKSPQEIAQIAQMVTVQVNTSIPGKGSGSGVIIAKQGNTYTVLTCDHVQRDVGDSPTIRTYDGNSYPVTNIQSLGSSLDEKDNDLALVTFTASSDYKTATIGNSDQAEMGAQIYVYGFPVRGSGADVKLGADREGEFFQGFVVNRPKSAKYGYSLRYDAKTKGGMSGGPVLDVDGRVIGIHGLGEQEMGRGATESGQEVSVPIKTGVNSAIPIKNFMSMKSKLEGIADRIAVDNSPSTDNPAARLSNPQSSTEFVLAGLVQSEQGNKSAALNNYTQAIQRDSKNADAYYQRGNIRYGKQDYQGALEDYSQAISLDADYTNAYFNRGVIYYNTRNTQGAIADFSQVIRLNPNFVEAYYNRGVTYAKLRDGQKALEDFDQTIRLTPKNPVLYYNRAMVRSIVKDLQGAVADLSEAISLNPKYVRAYVERASFRNAIGDKAGAIEDYTTAMSLGSGNPNYPVAQYNRGLLRQRLGDRQGALEDFNSAATLFKQQGDMAGYEMAINAIKRLSQEGVLNQPSPENNSVPSNNSNN
jgi:tetratricopeptide (TPR) repeat protein